MKNSLKPCPFCGSSDLMDSGHEYAVTLHNRSGRQHRLNGEVDYRVECRKCSAKIEMKHFVPKSHRLNAIPTAREIVHKKWNSRVEAAAV